MFNQDDDDLRSKAEVGSLKVMRSSKRVEVKFADAALCTEVFSGPSKVRSGSRAALQNAALDGTSCVYMKVILCIRSSV